MITHTHRAIVVEQRGEIHYVPVLDGVFSSEALAHAAIDKVLDEWLGGYDEATKELDT